MKELTEEQNEILELAKTYMPPEECSRIELFDDDGRERFFFEINQDTVPVIEAYLELVKEKMNE